MLAPWAAGLSSFSTTMRCRLPRRWVRCRLISRACCRARCTCRCAALANRLPSRCRSLSKSARRAEELARGFVTGGTLFEELGFYYVGVVDGHNLDQMIPVLENVRDA